MMGYVIRFFFTLVIICGIGSAASSTIDALFQTKCRNTFPALSKSEALTFLANGKRATPKACCEEHACEEYKQQCNTEQFRSLILDHYKWTCPQGQSVGITSWCVGHIEHKCTDPCKVLGVEQCTNGGTCVPQGSTWTCHCHQGYKGTICQVDIDECLTNNPCDPNNSVRCENTPGTYTCHCKAGFTGGKCEMDLDECAARPCRHSGTCTNHMNGFDCTCRSGYTGLVCETDIDECLTNNPCDPNNSVRCENTPGTYKCHCKAGFTGGKCEIEIDECASGPCQHSGTCTDHVNRFECTCRPGYTGIVCETDIDECASSPCQNGATCVDHVNFFRCNCAPGFYGTLCDTNICRPLPADVVFVLDSSVSMTESQFRKQLEFVANFTDGVRLGPRDFQISVITYSFDAHIEFYLDEYRDNATIKEAIANITYKPGATLTHLALEAVKTVFGPGHGGYTARFNNTRVDRFVYLMTDGMSNKRQLTAKVAKELRDDFAITISAIGIGNQVSHEELGQIASKTGTKGDIVSVYSVTNFNSLYTVLNQLVHVTCDECTRSKKSDVAIVMDTSASMTDEQFQISKNALTYIIDRMELGENKTQLSLTTYDTAISERFSFVDHTHSIPVINSVPKAFDTSKVDISEVVLGVKDSILSKGRHDARAFILLVSNGNFSQNSNDTDDFTNVKHSLAVAGVEMIVVGTGDDVNYKALLSLATDPFNVYTASDQGPFPNLDVIKTYFEYSECKLDRP